MASSLPRQGDDEPFDRLLRGEITSAEYVAHLRAKHGEMHTDPMPSRDTATLEPKLTRADLQVLHALPAWLEPRSKDYTRDHPMNVWRIGEQLREMDLLDLHRTLRGLVQLGYVMECPERGRQWPVRWMRTEKGDAAL